jgi:hypothetical protein
MVTKKVLKDKVEYRNEKWQLHRLDGPAVEWNSGTKEWWINGQLHREDGPAVEWDYGTKEWYINGQYHREDGPAIDYNDGDIEWWLNDKQYSERQWQQEVIRIKLERLKNYGN